MLPRRVLVVSWWCVLVGAIVAPRQRGRQRPVQGQCSAGPDRQRTAACTTQRCCAGGWRRAAVEGLACGCSAGVWMHAAGAVDWLAGWLAGRGRLHPHACSAAYSAARLPTVPVPVKQRAPQRWRHKHGSLADHDVHSVACAATVPISGSGTCHGRHRCLAVLPWTAMDASLLPPP
ncbi:hypothetical protein BC831DRAFT_476450 [Entophlyctis helioformis]|nr:hypothetical protein BC831DRAFT_476450 [Entophlyctis helioformis]